MITIIDYDAGNLASMEHALDRLRLAHVRAATPDEAAPEGALLLPGVGHFQAAVAALTDRGWWGAIGPMVDAGRPLFGVCLGLQLLAEGSEEAPGVEGLGLVSGVVRRLGPGVKVPHMGWATVTRARPHPALPDPTGAWLYFVHSYALDSGDANYLAEHGRSFAAAAGRGRVLGIQPHPEKSGGFGARVLGAVLAWMGEVAAPGEEGDTGGADQNGSATRVPR